LVNDENDNLYSYQFVIIKSYLKIVTLWNAQLALTNFSTGSHEFFDDKAKDDKQITIDEKTAKYADIASVVKTEKGMLMMGKADTFSFDFEMDYNKGAFWHCDKGYLLMGSADTDESTLYYSYTNMPTKGTITIDGKKINVTGKTWFDKQGGPFNQASVKTHWEWFSFRFFDEEEIMLFAFPQGEYYDGTYIRQNTAERLNNYKIEVKKIIEVDGLKFSSGWDITMPGIKDEKYSLIPILDTQRNGMYFEQVSEVFNASGEKVGYCVVELLPGARNEHFVGELDSA
jgi:hypothetical protein